jgi:RNA polymerase sigma-70 factor (ECF subfamily)
MVTAMALPDAAVIQESWRDGELFAVLYDRYAAQLYRFAYRRVGPEAAEDVVADAFLAAFRGRRRYDVARPDARPWLFGILTKEIARRRRSEEVRYQALARVGEVTVDGHADRVAAGVSAQAARASLAAALSRLAPGDRDVLLLVAWSDLTYEEVAQALGIPVGTVRSRLNRARRKTREALGGIDPTELTEER